MARKRLYLIDGTALAYRSFFAFAQSPRGGLSTKSGRPTGAVYGFLSTLRSLLDREQPDAIAVSFDGATADLERTRIYADYKSTRQKMPDDLTSQLDSIEAVVAGYGIPIVRSEGHEADDVIGTLAVRGQKAGMQVFIVTGDKDFMQLVGDGIKLYNLRTSTTAPEIIGPAEVEAKFGVRPDQIIDLLALMGDSSDNIPGVPRVGPKTAATLIQKFGSLDATLAGAGEVAQAAIRNNLTEFADQARLSRNLVTIHTDVPLTIDVVDIPAAAPDRKLLEPLFVELEFESLLKTLPRQPVPKLPTDYHVVRGSDELATLVDDLRQQGSFAVHVLDDGAHLRDRRVVGLAFSHTAGTAHFVAADLAGGIEQIAPLLADLTVDKFLHDAKRQMATLRNAGIELSGTAFDTMLAGYCLAPGGAGHSLDELSLHYLSHEKTKDKDVRGVGRTQRTFADIGVHETADFACECADLVWRLQPLLAARITELELDRVLRQVEQPLLPVLLDMEWEGVRIDDAHLARLGRTLGDRLAAIEERVFARAGEPFNLNAPAQIGAILFDRLEVHKAAGIRPKKTRTGQWKTDAVMLELLAAHHEVPELILEHRQLSKLKSTYVDSLPALVHKRTRRIHATLNQAVAATGRLSCEDPNLQNIPIRTQDGRQVRRAFVARDGWLLVSADYSQIELRIMAHMSKDPALLRSFRDKEDIHARTAAIVHGLLPQMVTPEMRNQAKIVNYGLIYGMGASRLARETGMTPPEAKRFIDAYFRALPKVKAWLDATLQLVRTEGAVRTILGRRRLLPEIDSSNAMQRIAAENMAVNTPIQGSAADIIKLAMLDVHRRLRQEGLQARLLLQVHDELLLETPKGELDAVCRLVKDAMENAMTLDVPLEVSIGHGHNWLDAH